MTAAGAAEARESFLARLDSAMSDLPHGVAGEIRAGVAEELDGLDAAATAARIAQLGEPAVIADGARAELRGVSAVTPTRIPLTRTRGYAITAALSLSFAGILVPVVGWMIGAVLVGLCGLWRTWEKAVAVLLPLVAVILTGVVGGILLPAGGASGADANPLLPASYDMIWSVTMLGVIIVPVTGIWLLWRLRGRTAD